MINDVNEELHG